MQTNHNNNHLNEFKQTVIDFEKAVAELAVNVLPKKQLQKVLEDTASQRA